MLTMPCVVLNVLTNQADIVTSDKIIYKLTLEPNWLTNNKTIFKDETLHVCNIFSTKEMLFYYNCITGHLLMFPYKVHPSFLSFRVILVFINVYLRITSHYFRIMLFSFENKTFDIVFTVLTHSGAHLLSIWQD